MSLVNNKKKPHIGLLGGTFDPIHHGHIYPALAVAKQLSLDTLFLLPAHIPPHKSGTHANPIHRKNMVEIACELDDLLSIDARELLRDTPSFTAETLEDIKRDRPDSTLYFFVGMDSLLSFTQWHRWQDILNNCHLIVTVRPGYFINNIKPDVYQQLKHYFCTEPTMLKTKQNGCIYFVEQPTYDISSTELRENISQLIFDQNKLPTKVIDYIKRHNLYHG